jgi:hypothetical protein
MYNYHEAYRRRLWRLRVREIQRMSLDQRWALRNTEQDERNAERARSWALRYRLQ